MVKQILPEGVECIFVRQTEQLGLGHAVLCAERAVANEPFAVLLADDFILHKDYGPIASLVEKFTQTAKTQVSVMEVIGPDISKYGVIIPNELNSGVAGLVEKPSADKAPSNLACIGRYLLTPDIFDLLRCMPTGVGGEIQLADAINIQAKKGLVESCLLDGERFDCGSVDGYIDAIMKVSGAFDRGYVANLIGKFNVVSQ